MLSWLRLTGSWGCKDIQGRILFSNNTEYWQRNSFRFVFQNVTSFFKLGGEDVWIYGGMLLVIDARPEPGRLYSCGGKAHRLSALVLFSGKYRRLRRLYHNVRETPGRSMALACWHAGQEPKRCRRLEVTCC